MAPEDPGILESRAAISDLVHRYALNIRSGNAAACENLLTPDVIFEVRETDPRNRAAFRVRSHVVGRSQTLDYIGRVPTSALLVCPLIHNLLIDVDGKEARSSCVMEGRTFPSGHDVLGEYDDSYRFEDGWRFSSRIYTIFLNAADNGPARLNER